MKTLFITDLDGTLLRNDKTISKEASDILNRLISEGMAFSYATARSFHTASKATSGLKAAFPVIVYNGAFIVDNASGEIIMANFFTQEEADEILGALLAAGVQPIVYAVVEGRERMMYLRERLHPGAAAFMDTRRGDVRDTPVQSENMLAAGDRFYFTCIDTPDKLEPLLRRFEGKYRCVYSADIYSDTQWLEIMPAAASKASAARQLAHEMNCDRIVAFGDHVNDLDLFALADESYAVGNAVPELKAAATAVIGTNEEDGVAHWLKENAR